MLLVKFSEYFLTAVHYLILLTFFSIHEGVFRGKKKQSMLGKKPKRYVRVQRFIVQFIFYLLPSTSYFLNTYAQYIHPSTLHYLYLLTHSHLYVFSPLQDLLFLHFIFTCYSHSLFLFIIFIQRIREAVEAEEQRILRDLGEWMIVLTHNAWCVLCCVLCCIALCWSAVSCYNTLWVL